MGKPRQPIELLLAKDRKHLTKAEIAHRLETEVKAPVVDVAPPAYLNATQRQEFADISRQLADLGIMTALDTDSLANFIIAKTNYLKFTKMLDVEIANGDVGIIEALSRLQDRAYKQMRQSATDLGLTISSRCRLVIPKAEEKPVNKFARFTNNL